MRKVHAIAKKKPEIIHVQRALRVPKRDTLADALSMGSMLNRMLRPT